MRVIVDLYVLHICTLHNFRDPNKNGSRGRGQQGHYRGKRSPLSVDHSEEDGVVNSLKLSPFFEAVASTDKLDCGKKLVCSIMALDSRSRTESEQKVVQLFHSIGPLEMTSDFELATVIGSLGRVELCQVRYPSCPLDDLTLRQMLQESSNSQSS